MRRRFIADTWSPQSGHPTHAALTGEQAVHLARVLRAQPGQLFDVVANGFLHRAEVTEVRAASGNEQSAEVLFTLHEELEADAALPIHLLLAIFKFDRFEWAIEKATELGVARITPILARRTEKHLALAAALTVSLNEQHTTYNVQQPLALAIGPEGGWTPEEISLFTTHAWTPVTLGPRILRAETAAIAALAVVASCLE
jgi:16S rRNA (uracil1498-N3)-methyltransferase